MALRLHWVLQLLCRFREAVRHKLCPSEMMLLVDHCRVAEQQPSAENSGKALRRVYSERGARRGCNPDR